MWHEKKENFLIHQDHHHHHVYLILLLNSKHDYFLFRITMPTCFRESSTKIDRDILQLKRKFIVDKWMRNLFFFCVFFTSNLFFKGQKIFFFKKRKLWEIANRLLGEIFFFHSFFCIFVLWCGHKQMNFFSLFWINNTS